MIKIKDSHTHSNHSFDGCNTPEEMVQGAVAAGADYIALTDHHDLYLPYIPSQVAQGRGGNFGKTDFVKHFGAILPLKEKYAGKIEIAAGAEFGYIKEAEADYLALMRYPFDVIINSVHSAGYEDLYEDAYYNGKSKRHTYELYLKEVLASLYVPYNFQIVGHLGYAERNAKYSDRRMTHSDFPDLLDMILKKMAQEGRELELNSHTKSDEYLYGPDLSILKRFKDLGGEFVTFGSDSHTDENVGFRWNAVREAVAGAGFLYITSFMCQKPRLHKF